MLLKVICGLILSVLLVFGAQALLRNKPQESAADWAKRNHIETAAARAKNQGRNAIEVPGPKLEYAGADMSLDKALQLYSVFIAEPVEQKSYLADAEHIATWYRFVIREVIAEKPPFVCSTCPELPQPPKELSAANSNEFLINKVGGTVAIDGVEVTMNDLDLPVFERGQQYLLFVSLDPGSRVATFGAGPSAAFSVNQNGKITPLSRWRARLHDDVEKRVIQSVDRLKAVAH
jgi:hypothetical protein